MGSNGGTSVFVSHIHDDKAVALWLLDRVRKDFDVRDRDRGVRERVQAAVARGTPWRTPGRVAVESAVSPDEALDVLRADAAYVFGSRHSDGALLVRLATNPPP